MKQNGFIKITALIILSAVILGLFLYLSRLPKTNLEPQTTNQTDFNTYSSNTYGLRFNYPKDWSMYDESAEHSLDDNTKVEIQLFPVKPGEPTGDSYFSNITIIENVTNFDKWYEENREFGAEKQSNYLNTIKEAYGYEYIKQSDINTTSKKIQINNFPAIEQITKITCPESPTCHILGWPTGYEKRVDIYNANKKIVVEFYVVTYSAYEATQAFDQIISSMVFVQ